MLKWKMRMWLMRGVLRTSLAVANDARDGTAPLHLVRAYFDAAPEAPLFVALTAHIA
jgi:hypothetical protein